MTHLFTQWCGHRLKTGLRTSGATSRPDNNLGLLLGFPKSSKQASSVKPFDCQCFRMQTNGQILLRICKRIHSGVTHQTLNTSRNELHSELPCSEMSTRPMEHNIMQPSALCTRMGGECLKLQYYNIFSSNKSEAGEGQRKTEIKVVLALLSHKHTVRWRAGSVWLIST